MKHIDELFKEFVNQSFFDPNIRNEQNYQQATDKLESIRGQFIQWLEKDENKNKAIELLDEYYDTYMDLIKVYLDYNFKHFLFAGIVIGMGLSNDEESESIATQIMNILNQ